MRRRSASCRLRAIRGVQPWAFAVPLPLAVAPPQCHHQWAAPLVVEVPVAKAPILPLPQQQQQQCQGRLWPQSRACSSSAACPVALPLPLLLHALALLQQQQTPRGLMQQLLLGRQKPRAAPPRFDTQQ